MDKKIERIISIYKRILAGQIIYKTEEAKRFHVTEKSIQRDLEDIRASFEKDPDSGKKLVYDRKQRGYLLIESTRGELTNSEIFTVCKILLESRSMVKEEMLPILDKLVKACVPFDQYQKVSSLITNEKYHYLEPHHGKMFVDRMHDKKLERLLAAAEIKPHVIQLEAHPYCTEDEIRDRLSEYGTKLMGWYPLGHGDSGLPGERVFQELGDKYHKSPAQIILRWHTQMGFITIPGSKNSEHIRANFDIFDFTLTDTEMAETAKLNGTKKYYEPDNETEEKYAEMHLPFERQ